MASSPFSSFSSASVDDSAVDAIIAEATDLCTLEQIAALNTAHLPDTPLPSNLENQFQKLKSFPATTNVDNENTPRSPNPSQSEPTPRSPSPPRQTCGCFGFCPRRRMQRSGGGGGKDDDVGILSELEFGSSALEENRRRLKKAWREHEKASQEAEKMVRWMKQVSARINEAAIDELLKEEFKVI